MTRFKGIKFLGKKSNEIFIKDKEKDCYIRTEDEVVDLLNDLADENEQLKADEKLYAKEILRLKEELKEKEMLKLGGDY